MKTGDKTIVDELFFNVGDFLGVFISHIINITDIIYPTDIENLKPAEIRELAKRKGTIKRKVNVDGIEKTSEASFVV